MTTAWAGMLLQYAASNAAVALPLAVLAFWVQGRGNRPSLAHLLWLIVLVKLVTPPIVSLPVVALPFVAPPAADANALAAFMAQASAADAQAAVTPRSAVAALLDLAARLDWKSAAVGLWILGGAIVLVWSCVRIVRFDRLLRATSSPAEPALQHTAAQLAETLGLERARGTARGKAREKVPKVMTTAATISPMVWWIGGAVRIYIPRAMLRQLGHAELSSILAHELGHVRRGDHFVRWLECAACIALWWNPLAWWARRNLRICEEICCDAFVLTKIDASRKTYAGALVSAMELLAAPTIRPSSLASNVNGGGAIERRIEMILSGRLIIDMPRWLRGGLLVAAAAAAPLGFTLAQAQDGDGLARVKEWLDAGVNSAFLTEEQAGIMLHALQFAPRLMEHDGNVILLRNAELAADAMHVAADAVHVFPNGHIPVGHLAQPEDGSPHDVFVIAHDGSGRRLPVSVTAAKAIEAGERAEAIHVERAEPLVQTGVDAAVAPAPPIDEQAGEPREP